MNRILLVEDEKNFAQVLRDYLRMNGFEVHHCADGKEALQCLQEKEFELCILDVMMPRKDGFSLAREMQGNARQTPFIFLTARSMREDVIKAYNLGADDYLVKPFDSEVLLLKIRAILNRVTATRNTELNSVYHLGNFRFESSMRELQIGNSKVTLSPKESALLTLLCQYQGQPLPRGKALREIWKDENYFTGRSMDVYIARLRKALSADPTIKISNVHGAGYALVAEK